MKKMPELARQNVTISLKDTNEYCENIENGFFNHRLMNSRNVILS